MERAIKLNHDYFVFKNFYYRKKPYSGSKKVKEDKLDLLLFSFITML